MKNRVVALVLVLSPWAGLALGGAAVLAQAEPDGVEEAVPAGLAEFSRDVHGCLVSERPADCLPQYVVERIYFPEVADLTATPVCDTVHRRAQDRDGHGWYLTAEEFSDCATAASHPQAGQHPGVRGLADELEACFRSPLDIIQASRDSSQGTGYAMLDGVVFTCSLINEDGWRLEAFHMKP